MNVKGILVSYDIKDDKKRTKLSNGLLNIGMKRVQASVFWGELSSAGLLEANSLIRSLTSKEDKGLIIPLCKNCLQGVNTYGQEVKDRKVKDVTSW